MRFILLPLLFAATPLAAAPPEVPFERSAESFADDASCRAHLVQLVADARGQRLAGVQGPYGISAGDVRAHMVVAEETGHRITEHRCLTKELSSRTWRHSMSGGESDEAATIESMAAKAEWLKKEPPR